MEKSDDRWIDRHIDGEKERRIRKKIKKRRNKNEGTEDKKRITMVIR